MPVIEHARTNAPAEYSSENHRKWDYNNSLYLKHLELYLDMMYKYLAFTGATRVLDAGCGEGIVYRAMRERGFKGNWIGFDYSAEAIEFCKHASPEAEWHVSSAYTLPFKDRSFELVFSSQVLEHLEGPKQPLKEFARVADKWMLLSVPYEPLFKIMTWFSVTLRLGGRPGHVNHWTPAKWRSFVQQVGRLHCWDRSTVYQMALVDMRGSDAAQTLESAL